MVTLLENTLCRKCLGCNQLEMPYFRGVYRCENFIDERGSILQVPQNKTNTTRHNPKAM